MGEFGSGRQGRPSQGGSVVGPMAFEEPERSSGEQGSPDKDNHRKERELDEGRRRRTGGIGAELVKLLRIAVMMVMRHRRRNRLGVSADNDRN